MARVCYSALPSTQGGLIKSVVEGLTKIREAMRTIAQTGKSALNVWAKGSRLIWARAFRVS